MCCCPCDCLITREFRRYCYALFCDFDGTKTIEVFDWSAKFCTTLDFFSRCGVTWRFFCKPCCCLRCEEVFFTLRVCCWALPAESLELFTVVAFDCKYCCTVAGLSGLVDVGWLAAAAAMFVTDALLPDCDAYEPCFILRRGLLILLVASPGRLSFSRDTDVPLPLRSRLACVPGLPDCIELGPFALTM